MFADLKAEITAHIHELESAKVALAESETELRCAMAELSELMPEVESHLVQWRQRLRDLDEPQPCG